MLLFQFKVKFIYLQTNILFSYLFFKKKIQKKKK